MRSILRLAVFVTLIHSVSAMAWGFFPVNPFVQIRPDVVSAQVYNPYYEPILCEGFAFGQTAYGQVFQARVADIIPAGQHRFAFVYTNAFTNPFRHGWAQVMCRFLRY
jgi:hypothetical protein